MIIKGLGYSQFKKRYESGEIGPGDRLVTTKLATRQNTKYTVLDNMHLEPKDEKEKERVPKSPASEILEF